MLSFQQSTWPNPMRVIALLIVTACLGGEASAGCTLEGVRSGWAAVALSGALPDGVRVEWRSQHSKAFGDCMNEVTLSISNAGDLPHRLAFDRCEVDGARQMGIDVMVYPGRTKRQMLSIAKGTSPVQSVSCVVRPSREAEAAKSDRRIRDLLAAKPADEKEESALVLQLIDLHLKKVERKQGATDRPVAERIQNALMEVTELREQRGMSGNVQLRDAEYYLHGLYAGASGDLGHAIPTWGAPVYDKIKAAEQRLGVDLMRANPDNPNSPPGGAPWAAMGLADGKRIKGSGDIQSFLRDRGLKPADDDRNVMK